MAQNVNAMPAVVLISVIIELYVDFNFIRLRLVNFVYTVYIYIVSDAKYQTNINKQQQQHRRHHSH